MCIHERNNWTDFRWNTGKILPLTEIRLFGWHNSLFQTGFNGYQQIDIAKYRSAGMKVISGNFGREKVHFEAPEPERVKPEMDRFRRAEMRIIVHRTIVNYGKEHADAQTPLESWHQTTKAATWQK